jgi:hypothetical protein
LSLRPAIGDDGQTQISAATAEPANKDFVLTLQ